MISRLVNNIGICSLGIAFTAQQMVDVSVSKALLITPMISNAELLGYLARQGTNIFSLEQLIVKKPRCFLNFNDRFYDTICASLNSIQFLVELGILRYKDGTLSSIEKLDYDRQMGKRADKLFKASRRIATIFTGETIDLYTNLRIKL